MRSRVLTFVAVVGALTLFAVSSADAATPAPAWRIESIANPTAFSSNDTTNPPAGGCAPCDKYQLHITNVGGAPANGEPITVTDTLPEGVTTSERPSGNDNDEWECEPGGEGQSRIKCTLQAPPVSALHAVRSLTVNVQVGSGVPTNSVRPNLVKVEGGGAATVEAETPTLLNPTSPLSFGFANFGSYLVEVAGAPDTQAADHPNSLTTSFDVNSAVNVPSGNVIEPTRSVQDVKDVVVDLPAGFVGDPQAAQQCPLHDLVTGSTSSGCPAASQVGVLSFDASGYYELEVFQDGRQNIPIYNMVPEHGYPAEFGFLFAGQPLVMYASVVGNGASAHVRVSIPGVPASQTVSLQGAEVTFFGDPTVQDGLPGTPVAFFTNPSNCSGQPLVTSIHADSWQNQGARNADGTPDFSDPAWKSDTAETPAVEGCGALHFNPTISLTPDMPQAGAPTGLGVNLEVPQNSDPSIPATPDLRQVVVKLPPGMVVSPSAANGLGACSLAQIALEDNDPPTCPESSKIATVKVKTPLLAEELEGSVYLAQQGNAGPAQGSNPFNTLLAGYIVVEGSGVVLKIPGEIEANEQTGQLTATFAESPQLPFSDFELHFTNGPRAPLSNPPACGTYTPEASLSAWSGQTVQSNRSFPPIAQGENGTPCPGSVFAPSFTAGTANNQAGAFTPFTLTFSRADEDQTLGGIAVQMPPGLLGRIAGVPRCPEAQANAGTCGAESLVGHTTVGAGPGSDPFYVSGNVYLTEGYKGAPFGLSIVVPVVAGPFNLGTEVIRAAIAIDPYTAQITVTSNPLPTIKEGIPFQVRTVNVTIERPGGQGFTFNPTNCTPSSIGATLASTQGTQANVSSPFDAANCAALPFKPDFSAATTGKTSKALGANLHVGITSAGLGQANIAKVDVEIPKALPTQLKTLQKACTEAQFNSDPANCPPASNVAQVTVHTPLLNSPLTGPAYLVSHGNAAFPDVEIVLQGENNVELVLDGHTQIKQGVTYSHFETVPDAPFTSFEFNSRQGELALFTANGDLCDQKLTMPVTLTGQNGAVLKQNTPIEVTGCSSSLSVVSSKVKKKTLTLSVYVPGAGKVTTSAKGLSSGIKTYSGREVLTFTLKQKQAGKLSTKIKLTFTPSKGRRQTKEVRASFRG